MVDLNYLEKQLKKRWQLPLSWWFRFEPGIEQKVGFIYQIFSFEEMMKASSGLNKECHHYAVNRWYNFWSQWGLKEIFAQHGACKKQDNSENILLGDIPFKIKSFVYPHHFARTLRYALLHKEELLYWLYRHANRKLPDSLRNKIFVILYSRDGEHWRLKAELHWLQSIIGNYLNQFDAHRLIRLHLAEKTTHYADIVWAVREV